MDRLLIAERARIFRAKAHAVLREVRFTRTIDTMTPYVDQLVKAAGLELEPAREPEPAPAPQEEPK